MNAAALILIGGAAGLLWVSRVAKGPEAQAVAQDGSVVTIPVSFFGEPVSQAAAVPDPLFDAFTGLLPIPQKRSAAALSAGAQDYMARTMWAEARGEGDIGMRAVGHVVLNRANDSRWPSAIEAVVTQPGQFSPWAPSDPQHQAMLSVGMSDPAFARAWTIAGEILSGQSTDPTGGARYFANEAAVSASNTNFWRWWPTLGPGRKIGNHTFKYG